MQRLPIVQKYGGSSVASIDRLRKIADKVLAVARSGHPVVVVVSAMGKTTSDLLGLAEQASAATGSDRLPQRELDMLVSTGERVTMSLLAIMLEGLGGRALSLTGSQSGIITTETHFNSRILEVRPRRILQALEAGKIVVVAGYQGVSQKGEVTTLGRGGSDTTAVALAAAVGAQHCEIYSDVDGVYSSDPRRVPSARHLSTIGYGFMWDMAGAGARVLNQEAVRLARDSNVRILARSTFQCGDFARQTVVTQDSEVPPRRAVVECDDVSELHASPDLWERFASEASATGVAVEDARPDAGAVRAWVRCEPLAARTIARFRDQKLKVRDGLSLVSLIGPEANHQKRHRLFGSGVSITHDSERRLSALVQSEQAGKLSRALHRAYVERAAENVRV